MASSEWSQYNTDVNSFYDPSSNVSNMSYTTSNFNPNSNYDFSVPNSNVEYSSAGGTSENKESMEFEEDLPLLEELGINVEHIVQKTMAVLNPLRKTSTDVAGDSDLAGPLVFCLMFGSVLLLAGKVHFNYIYGIGLVGCTAIYGLLSLMANKTEVHFTVVVSVLGYCVLPVVVLGALSIVFSLQGIFGNGLAFLAIVWCALSSSKLFVQAFEMEHQQLLVAYPCSMLYAIFALITIF